jgi:hypothetical protein
MAVSVESIAVKAGLTDEAEAYLPGGTFNDAVVTI